MPHAAILSAISFEDLLSEPGVVEVLELRSRIGFLAFHGGSLERMTDVVAIDAARRSGASVYAVVQPAGLRRHIRSVDVSPDASPALRAFVDHVEVAIAIHGFGREGYWTSLLLGGTNRDLAKHVGDHLRAALADYVILDDLDDIPVALRGLHPRNPVNLPRRGGVQIELPPRVRGTTPHWEGWDGPGHCPPLEALVVGLAHAVQSWPA